MAKKTRPPRAGTYKRVKGHNKTTSARMKGFDIKKIHDPKKKKKSA